MRRTISDKKLLHHKKEEFVVKQKTQYEIFKEEYDRKLKQKLNTVEERVTEQFNKFIYLYKFFLIVFFLKFLKNFLF